MLKIQETSAMLHQLHIPYRFSWLFPVKQSANTRACRLPYLPISPGSDLLQLISHYSNIRTVWILTNQKIVEEDGVDCGQHASTRKPRTRARCVESDTSPSYPRHSPIQINETEIYVSSSRPKSCNVMYQTRCQS
jgi:hypothetical protein